MWIGGIVGVALTGALVCMVILAIQKFKQSSPTEQVREQAIDRRKDLEELGGELEYKILDPLQVSPSLFNSTSIKVSIISDSYQEEGITRTVEKILVDYTFIGRRKDYERVKAEYVRPPIMEFLKENPELSCRLNSVHKPNQN
jgi:hypothetical protein